jgi:hypothetical protein
MEILFEILGWLFELFGEVLLQFIFEVLAEWGVRAARKPLRMPTVDPWVAALGYMLLGTGAGLLSVWLVPHSFITWPMGRLANVIVTPLLTGALMALVGAWRRRRGQDVLRIDRFFHGFLFAFAMALVRYFHTQT